MTGHEQQASAPRGGFYIPKLTSERGIFVDGQEEYMFTAFLKALSARHKQPFGQVIIPDKHLPMTFRTDRPDTTVNRMVQIYGLVVVLYDGEQELRHCYSMRRRNSLPPAFLDAIQHSLHVMPESEILWSDDVFKSPERASAGEILYGQDPRPQKTRRLTRRELQGHWEHPEELSPEELKYLTKPGQAPVQAPAQPAPQPPAPAAQAPAQPPEPKKPIHWTDLPFPL